MGLLAPLAALLGIELESQVSRAKATALIYGFIGLFLLSAAIFLIAAGYMALAELTSPIIAALIMAGIFLVLALAVYLGALIGRGRQQREVTKRRKSSETGALITTAALTALPMVMKSPAFVKLGIPAAALAIYAITRDNSDRQDS